MLTIGKYNIAARRATLLCTALAAAAALASGCAASYQRGWAREAPSGAWYETSRTSHFLLFGLFQWRTIDAAAACGGADKVAEVSSRPSFEEVVWTSITFGLYAPRSARIRCLGAPPVEEEYDFEYWSRQP